jgi:hypothetical protein
MDYCWNNTGKGKKLWNIGGITLASRNEIRNNPA